MSNIHGILAAANIFKVFIVETIHVEMFWAISQRQIWKIWYSL